MVTGSTVPNEVWRDGLECTVGRARIAVPRELVESIVEIELSPPPPLSRQWVGGLGHHQDKVVVCVSLVRSAGPIAVRRQVKGVLCRVTDSEVRWLLEVGKVASFVKARLSAPRAVTQNDALPSWIGAAATDDKRAVGFVDVEAMVRELAGTA